MHTFQVIWAKSAEIDLEFIINFIKTDSLDRAKNNFYEIKKECEKLNTFPNKNRTVPELQQIGISEYKELIHKRWRIMFKVDSTNVYIMSVVDSSRNLEDILFQRLLGKK